MKKIKNATSGRVALAVAGLSVAFAVTASANCGTSATPYSGLPRLAVATLPEAVTHTQDATGASTSGGSIVGLWKTSFISGGLIVDQGFDQWSSDGTEILNDDPAPSTGNVCLGVYVKSGATYKLKHPSWTFDSTGDVNGTAIIREWLAVGPDGNTYAGTYTIVFYDLSGNTLGEYVGTIAAQRITVDF